MGLFPTLYPRLEPKPDVLLLYTNSVALKKITDPRCLFFNYAHKINVTF
jgi:hypothetical protein